MCLLRIDIQSNRDKQTAANLYHGTKLLPLQGIISMATKVIYTSAKRGMKQPMTGIVTLVAIKALNNSIVYNSIDQINANTT